MGNFELAELGIDGPADVLAIEPCPEIEPGRGRVITGTFTTARCSVLELRLSNGEVLEPTPPHRFFSETRQDWVAAGELRVGECLRTASRQAVTLESVSLKAGEHRVYNLEVEQEHQFYVGESGVLVHNAYDVSEVDGLSFQDRTWHNLDVYEHTPTSRQALAEVAEWRAQNADQIGVSSGVTINPETGLPTAEGGVVAKLEYGTNDPAWGWNVNQGKGPMPPEFVEPQTWASQEAWKHAEGQAINTGAGQFSIDGGTGVLVTDVEPCAWCGRNGGIAGLAGQAGLDRLIVISPRGIRLLNL